MCRTAASCCKFIGSATLFEELFGGEGTVSAFISVRRRQLSVTRKFLLRPTGVRRHGSRGPGCGEGGWCASAGAAAYLGVELVLGLEASSTNPFKD